MVVVVVLYLWWWFHIGGGGYGMSLCKGGSLNNCISALYMVKAGLHNFFFPKL